MQKNRFLKIASCALLIVLLVLMCVPCVYSLEFTPARNNVSTSYLASPYYDNFSSVILTGDGRTDVIAVALSQLGYVEGNADGEFSGLNAGSDNFTEYNYNMGNWGVGYGGKDYPWCAAFVSFCLLQAKCHTQTSINDWCRKHQGDSNYIWREVSCQQWANQLRLCEYFENSLYFEGDYTPIAGDLIFFTSNGSTESHIGIVLWTDEQNVYTVEGNTGSALGLETNGDGVYLKSYPLESSYIRGYGVLPYKENPESKKIDYSATELSAGLFVTAGEKGFFQNEEDEEPILSISPYTQFELLKITDSGNLEIIFRKDDNVHVGYIKQDDSRIIQLTRSDNVESFKSYQNTEGFKALKIEEYSVVNYALSTKPTDITVPNTHSLKISGYVGFKNKVTAFGYYFDGNTDDITWSTSISQATDKAIISAAGSKASLFSIDTQLSALEVGKHTLTFVTKLNNTQTALLDTLSFNIVEINEYLPFSPSIKKFSETSITLEAIDGYEYRANDGEWQKEPVFDGLEKETEYSFYQRISATSEYAASQESAPVSSSIKQLDLATRLLTLTVNNGTLCADFDPYTEKYSVTVSPDTQALDLNVTVQDGSTFKISDTALTEDETEIKITVTSPLGAERVYTLSVKVQKPTQPPKQNNDYYVEEESGCASSAFVTPMLMFSVGIAAISIRKKK